MSLRRLSHFELHELLGEGAMGRVYRAVDLNLERPVAIKLLSGRTLGDPSFLDRFKREARLAAQLNHPNIATIYAFGEEEGEAYIAMEFVEGETLSAILEGGALPIPQVRKYGRQAAAALAVAHAKGIVHRDIKPANLMVTREGELKVMDFGVARRTGETQLTMAGSIIGTANIMAPEIVRGGEATSAADLFSLGCVLYEMLAGHRAFDGQDAMAVLYLVMNEEPRPLAEFRAEIPPDLSDVVTGLLHKDPARRLGPAARVAEMLAGESPSAAGATMVLGGTEAGTMLLPPGSGAPAAEGRTRVGTGVTPLRSGTGRRRPPRWALAAPVGALLLLGGWYFFFRPNPPDPAAAEAANREGLKILADFKGQEGTLAPATRDSLLRTAGAHFDRAIAADPTSPTAWNNLGDVYRNRGDLGKAESKFEKATALDRDYVAAWLNLADVLEQQNLRAQAIEPYRRALALNDSTLKAIARSSDPAAGAKAAQRDPTLVLAPNNLGHLFIELEMPDSAYAVLHEAVGLFPQVAALWKNYGLALLGRGDFAAADSAFDHALAIVSGYSAALAGKAEVAEGRRDWDAARLLWTPLVEDPDTALAGKAGRALRRLGS